MSVFEEGHPCRGKDCKDCETCIFDEDLFLDKVQPNKKEKMGNTRLCNLCVNLDKSYDRREGGRFDAACKVTTFPVPGGTRPRRIDFNLSQTQDIPCPTWCPMLASANSKGLPSPSQVTHRPNPQTTGPQPTSTETTPVIPLSQKPISELTYSEKRELMKELPKHIEWADIKEGNKYVIPRILSQSRKIVKVITKTDMCCTCHEISEFDGHEYSYNCSVYPSDLDAVFITEIHDF